MLNAIDASPLDYHRGGAWGDFRRWLRTGAGVRSDHRRQDGEVLFPELRLGLIPGFGGIPRLKRDLGNAVVRDLLLTGRSLNATKVQQVGLVSQVVAEGDRCEQRGPLRRSWGSLIGARRCGQEFIKPIPHDDLRKEIDIFCELFAQPAVEAGLRKFVESEDAQPYLP